MEGGLQRVPGGKVQREERSHPIGPGFSSKSLKMRSSHDPPSLEHPIFRIHCLGGKGFLRVAKSRAPLGKDVRGGGGAGCGLKQGQTE